MLAQERSRFQILPVGRIPMQGHGSDFTDSGLIEQSENRQNMARILPCRNPPMQTMILPCSTEHFSETEGLASDDG